MMWTFIQCWKEADPRLHVTHLLLCLVNLPEIIGSISSGLSHLQIQRSSVSSGFSGGSDCKVSARNAGDLGSIPGSGRSLEKEMATHSSILTWRIPWMEEPGRLQSTGSQRVSHDWATSLHFTSSLFIKQPSNLGWLLCMQKVMARKWFPDNQVS